MDILIFRTSVGPNHVELIKPILSSISSIEHWNFDLDDRDRILRIVAQELDPRHIECTLREAGFICSELED